MVRTIHRLPWPTLVIPGRHTPSGRVLRPIFYTAKHANEAVKKARQFPETIIEFRTYDGRDRRYAIVRAEISGYYREELWSPETGLVLAFAGFGRL